MKMTSLFHFSVVLVVGNLSLAYSWFSMKVLRTYMKMYIKIFHKRFGNVKLRFLDIDLCFSFFITHNKGI